MDETIECVFCSGGGMCKDPLDRDSYEGLKMAQVITCSACEGLGKVDVSTKLGHQLIAAQEARGAWRATQNLRTGALKKLTRAERDALGV